VPSKASRAIGNGRCKLHPHTATACRLCLVQGLQEFRHANVRAGIRLATERIKKLRTSYLSRNGGEVKMADVAVALTSLLSKLETAEKQVGELPVDVGLVLRAPSVKNRCFWSAPGRMKVATAYSSTVPSISMTSGTGSTGGTRLKVC
jgi:hypothetical protein